MLVIFWCASHAIALMVAFSAARQIQILINHGIGFDLAQSLTIINGFADISVGLGIGFPNTCCAGLFADIVVSLVYMVGAAILTPDLWAEPLGALVKTGPAIALMLFCLMIWDDR